MEKSKTTCSKWRMEKSLINSVVTKKNINYFLKIILILSIQSCAVYKNHAKKKHIPSSNFDYSLIGKAPEYSNIKYWAEHPAKESYYAILPKNYTDSQYNKNPVIDVFFIHPTLYLKGDTWNADIENKELNKKIGNSTIKHQASVFLGIANIYAPYYRQMHIHSYSDLKNGYQAYDIAYSDVKNAFLYYWKEHNKLKKFILAGHSQGTNHCERLLKEIILKNDTMKDLLIISYLPGMPIIAFNKDHPPCNSPNQLECFLSWRTFAEGYIPQDLPINDSIVCINPISWNSGPNFSEKNEHLGILFKNHKIKYPKSITAYNYNSMLWIKPIKIPFAFLYKRNDYHIADYNLFWLNIRNNLKYRLNNNGYL